VFSLVDPSRVSGAQVLLVDDVYTTGSTVNACSKVLRRAGAERIEVFTLARSLTS
jgi:predicted amidophosphoribosyltransferase